VRYPDGGGLTAEGRARREQVRLQAARWFAEDAPVAQIARRLRVSQNAVYTWRRRWRAGGEQALLSKGASGSPCRLSDEQLARLAAALEQGPAVWSYTERRGPGRRAVTGRRGRSAPRRRLPPR
jgi:transposase